MQTGKVLRCSKASATYTCFRHDAEPYLGVDEAGARLRQVPLVGDEAGAAEAAGAAQLVHPFRPLRV